MKTKTKDKTKNNNFSNIFAILAIIVIVLALVSIFVNLSKVPEFRKKLTGYASGYVNLTINTQITLNVTNEYVNFSAGTVTGGSYNATLTTHGNGTNSATVLNGNWSVSAQALSIANIGSINCSINISGTKTAVTLFGGSTDNQQYQWNISNKDANSCGAWGADNSSMNRFGNVNVTSGATVICNKLDYTGGRNQMFIDFKLVVPYDATLTGAQGDIITITGNSAI